MRGDGLIFGWSKPLCPNMANMVSETLLRWGLFRDNEELGKPSAPPLGTWRGPPIADAASHGIRLHLGLINIPGAQMTIGPFSGTYCI